MIVKLFLLFLSQQSVQSLPAEGDRQRLLNVFNIIKFPNDGCNSTAGTYGTCYAATECEALGGASMGQCAGGFGVCCSFTGGCGGTTSVNNTYFVSSSSDSSPCQFSVCKVSDDICHIRLNFDTFDISQPSTAQAGDGLPGQRTQCLTAQFSVTSDGASPPVICGTNTGYHMIIDADADCNKMTFSWNSAATSKDWNIHIMQISCTAADRPPPGCLQFFTGPTGTISSFNYNGGTHLANNLYSACVRPERGYCSIGYTATDATSFQISSQNPNTATDTGAYVGDSCTTDYIEIVGGSPTVGDNQNFDRFCGKILNFDATSAAIATVYSNIMPYRITVFFDGTELDVPGTPSVEYSKGFNIYYSQALC